MRVIVPESERRPDPAPVVLDARVPVLAGTIAWMLAVAAAAVWSAPLADAGHAWYLATAVAGAAIGLIGLVVLQLRRARARRASAHGG